MLPIGQQTIETKNVLDTDFISDDLERIKIWLNLQIWKQVEQEFCLPGFRITQGAYSTENKRAIEQYLCSLFQENERVREVLLFALLCVLESISYTRKDGQYPRWDYRSGRGQGKKPFNKGEILDFDAAITRKLEEINVSEKGLIDLRQEMLSCTVENRSKDLLSINPNWKLALEATNSQPLLQAILNYLDYQKLQGILNNNGIPRMVRGYFYEMACVIQECSRVLKPGALLFMVNDNVRYSGISISVDMILSDFIDGLPLMSLKQGHCKQQQIKLKLLLIC